MGIRVHGAHGINGKGLHVDLETTKYTKYTKKAAAPQDCMWIEKPQNTQNTQKKRFAQDCMCGD